MTPVQNRFTRCAVSIAYCEPSAIADGGTCEGEYSSSPAPPGTVVVVVLGVLVVGVVVVVVVDGAVVVVVDGGVVVVVGPDAVKSGVMKYSDSA
jgi:hypothetical protein